MKSARRIIAILMSMILFFSNMGLAVAESVLTLPAAVRVIEEEAFYGSDSIEKVVLPENIEEIQARAFANSTLSEVNLPDSLTFIADDAFDGPEKVTVTVNEDTYAYDWAVEHLYLTEPLKVVSVDSDAPDEVSIGDTVTWTTEASGGDETYRYQFALYKDSTRIKQSSYSTKNTFTYTFEEGGVYHIIARVRDGNYTVAEKTLSSFLVMDWASLLRATVSSDVETAFLHDSITWTAQAQGGTEPYRYAFTLFINGTQSGKQTYSSENTYTVKAEIDGNYTVKVEVLDSVNESCTADSEICTVNLHELVIDEISGSDNAQTEDEITWNVKASGGLEPYSYTYTLSKGSTEIDYVDAANESSYTATLMDVGIYTLSVLVRDAAGNKANETMDCTVTLRPVAIKKIEVKSDSKQTDDEIIWTVETEGGTRTYFYLFSVYQDEEEVDFRAWSEDNTFTYVPEVAGTYFIEVSVRDTNKTTASKTGGEIQISTKPLTIVSISVEEERVRVGNSASLTTETLGGVAPLRYSYTVYQEGNEVAASPYSLSANYAYKASEAGTFTFKVSVKDAEDTVVSLEGGTAEFYNAISLNSIVGAPETVQTGEAVIWTVDREGGKGEITYKWYVYCNGDLEFSAETTENEVKWAPKRAGTYTAKAVAVDEDLESVEISGGAITSTLHPSNPIEDFVFETIDGSHTKITGYKGADTAIILPAEDADGRIVTQVSSGNSYGFKGNTRLISVSLPERVKIISSDTFSGCTSLIWFDASTALESIEVSAFRDCLSLTDITLYDQLETIQAYAFFGCGSLQSIVLPDSVNKMGYGVFSGCINLTNVNFPLNWTTKERSSSEYTWESPFVNCPKLTKMTVPEGVETIPAFAFYDVPSLEEVILPSTLTEIGLRAFHGCTSIREIVLPEQLIRIDEDAFEGCSGLRNIDLPAITYLGNEAFENCSCLYGVILPGSLKSVGNGAFKGCTGLVSVKFEEGISIIPEFMFSGCSELEIVNLPESLLQIGARAFENCESLKKIHIPDGVTNLSYSVFTGCSELNEVNFPLNWTTKDWSSSEYTWQSPFVNCPNLTKITIPEGVKTIPKFAFYNASSMVEVILPSTLTEIGLRAFRGCISIKEIVLPEQLERIEEEAFEGCSGLKSIEFPAISYLGKEAFENCSRLYSVILPGSLTSIGDGVFKGCTGLVSIKLEEGITFISDFMFSGCGDLEIVNLPESLLKIGVRAFENCTSLKNIHIPDGVTNLSYSIFTGCNKLREVNFPLNWTTKDWGSGEYTWQSPFVNCPNLTKITIPEGVKAIPKFAFYNASSLVEVILPSTLTEIGLRAFQGCISIKEIVLPEQLERIDEEAFEGCSGLRSIEFPAISYLGKEAFENCSSLYSVMIPESLKSIGDAAFKGCTGLISMMAEEGLTALPYSAFSGCEDLEIVNLPSTLTSIGNNAFYNCSALSTVNIHASVSKFGSNCFSNCNKDLTFYCNEESELIRSTVEDYGYKFVVK